MMGHKCEFPDCGKMAIRHDSFFGKFHCDAHDFHKAVWPRNESFLEKSAPKKPGGKQFGKNYFKKDKK